MLVIADDSRTYLAFCNELIDDPRQVKLYGKAKGRCNQEKTIFRVGSYQGNGLDVLYTGYTLVDEQVCNVIANPGLELAVDGCIKTFFSTTTDADYGIEEDGTP